MEDIIKGLEQAFYEYTQKYDQNIKDIIKEKEIEISDGELEEILKDAKYRL